MCISKFHGSLHLNFLPTHLDLITLIPQNSAWLQCRREICSYLGVHTGFKLSGVLDLFSDNSALKHKSTTVYI